MKEVDFKFSFKSVKLLINQLNSCREIVDYNFGERIVYMDRDCNFQTQKLTNAYLPPIPFQTRRPTLLHNKLENFSEVSSSCVEDGCCHSICCESKLEEHKQPQRASGIDSKVVCSTLDRIELRNPSTILKAGFLERRSNNFFKTWKTHFCLATFQKLQCFEDETRTQLISCLNLKRVKCFVERSGQSQRMFCLKCEDQNESFVFRAEGAQQCQSWMREISFIIRSNQSHPKIKIRQAKKGVYLEEDCILQCQLLQMAETGDILLMRTENSSCAWQRLVTNSQYDHVSMLIKFINGDVKIFEANADEGVQIYDWYQFQNRFDHFEKICVRKLYHGCSQQMHAILLAFIKKMIGSKYKMNALQLLRKCSDQELAEGPRNFFCSQLIARAYKQIGLLNAQKSSNRYWPVDFTCRGGIVLENGAFLGSEKLVILQKHIKTMQ